MTDLLLPVPYPGPYTVGDLGAVHAADGTLIGSAASRYMGLQAHMAMTARLFAAAPQLGDALIRLSTASRALLEARGPGDHDVAATAILRAQALGWEAVANLRDPKLRPDAALNGHVSRLLESLPGGAP